MLFLFSQVSSVISPSMTIVAGLLAVSALTLGVKLCSVIANVDNRVVVPVPFSRFPYQ